MQIFLNFKGSTEWLFKTMIGICLIWIPFSNIYAQIDLPNTAGTASICQLPTMKAPASITVAYYGAVPKASTIPFSNSMGGTCLMKGLSKPSTFSKIPGANGGLVTETWTAKDRKGRTIKPVSRTITVKAASSLTMKAPGGYTISCGYLPPASSIAYGNFSGGNNSVIGTSNLSTKSTITGVAGGKIIETWTATDKTGKTIIPVSRILIVMAGTLPIMKVPTDIVVDYGGVPAASTLSYSNYAGGSCLLSGKSSASTFSAIPGASGGKVTETWVATDIIGRKLIPVSRIIKVNALIHISMIPPGGYTISCGYVPAASRIAFGNFSGGNYLVMGTSNLSTMSAIPGTAGGIITETWTATDNKGKTIAPVTRILKVSAANLPLMKAPADIIVSYGAVPSASRIVYNNYSDGKCLVTGNSNLSTQSGTVGTSGGTITETWTAKDNIGRTIVPVSRIITVKAATSLTSKVNGSLSLSSASKLELASEDKLSVYPNPARGIINLKVTGDVNKVTLVEITDVLGKVIYSSKHYQSIINLSNHVAGTYFIRVNNNSKITTTKVVMVR